MERDGFGPSLFVALTILQEWTSIGESCNIDSVVGRCFMKKLSTPVFDLACAVCRWTGVARSMRV